MKIFDLQIKGLSYHFKIWDNELPEWKELRRSFDWQLTTGPRKRWEVFREVQLDATSKSLFDALTEQLLAIPGIEFEGGIRLSRRSAKTPSQRQHTTQEVNAKSQPRKRRS
jgi:hypothetical protein